jgi:hypothetical protein
MAAHGDHQQGGSMDITDHVRTWNGFVTFIKVSGVLIGALMVFLAIFRTHG